MPTSGEPEFWPTRVKLSDPKGWLPEVYVNGKPTNLASWMASVEDRLATSPASSAPTTGPATKPSVSSTGTPVALTENQREILTPIAAAIMACIKSTPSTPHEWAMTWDGSSILLRISESPTASGSNAAGSPGLADLEGPHLGCCTWHAGRPHPAGVR